MIKLLIIGGYGNFGSYIAKSLKNEKNVQLIISGRNGQKAKEFADSLNALNKAQHAKLDINNKLQESLTLIKPDIVIHTSGPYQGQSYHVAEACIEHGCHYIDLADARDFVANISSLKEKAKKKNVLICSGASSVPCLSSAVIDKYIGSFSQLEKIEYAISTAQKTNRGLATTAAVLSYAGKPFQTLINGKMQDVYGWLDFRLKKFWGLKKRPLGNCDIPDLEIFPSRYPTLKTIRFQAGLELKFLHIILFLQSWLVRLKALPSLDKLAPIMLKTAKPFDVLGTNKSGFYMNMFGKDTKGDEKHIKFEILAAQGDGLYIPSTPAIILAKKFANGELNKIGATPCVGIITLDEYMDALKNHDIKWQDNTT